MPDCIVIGGGVIGLMSAMELRAAGLSVTLLERGEIGQESSWAGGGILSPLCPWLELPSLNQLVTWGQQQYPSLVKKIHQNTGIDPEYSNCGLLFTCLPEASMSLAHAWIKEKNIAYERIDSSAIAALEPHIKVSAEKTALLLPEISTIRNPRLMRALSHYVIQQRVDVHCKTAAQLLPKEGSNKVVVHTKERVWEADCIVVAGGAWSGQLWPEEVIDVRPVKGQMLLYHPKAPLINRVIIEDGSYLIPRCDGRILVGSTVEFCGFDKETTVSAAMDLSQRAISLLPALQAVEVEKHWAGLRPGTCRKTPYICRHPSYKNLYLNTGHFRNGFSLAPASARLLTDLILQRKPIFDASPFAINSIL